MPVSISVYTVIATGFLHANNCRRDSSECRVYPLSKLQSWQPYRLGSVPVRHPIKLIPVEGCRDDSDHSYLVG